MSITFLDGGMGQELVARAGKATSLWSVQALIDDPEAVLAVHNEYFVAGADVATTNTYSILPDRLEKHGLLDHLEKLQKLACQLASDARDLNGKGIVAGSLGPQGFSYQANAYAFIMYLCWICGCIYYPIPLRGYPPPCPFVCGAISKLGSEASQNHRKTGPRAKHKL